MPVLDSLKILREAISRRWSAASYNERLDAPIGSPRVLPRWLPVWLARNQSGGPGRDTPGNEPRLRRRLDLQSFNERLDRGSRRRR